MKLGLGVVRQQPHVGLTSLSCAESRSMSFIMGNTNTMRYKGVRCSLAPVLPRIPLYPDLDDTDIVVATQMTKQYPNHNVNTVPDGYLFPLSRPIRQNPNILCVYEF